MAQQETKHYVLAYPEDYYRMDTQEGRQEFLEWLEKCLAKGLEYVQILPGGAALFRKATPKSP